MKSYISLSQFKARLSPLTATTYDADILGLLQHTSDQLDHECHRFFECQEGVRYAEGSGTTLLFNDDVLSLSAVALDMDGDGTYETPMAATDYILYPLNEYPKMYMKTRSSTGLSFPSIRAGIKLTGVFGYGDGYTATPYDASGAVLATGGISAIATTHTLAQGYGMLFSPGQTLRIDSEQMFISNASGDILTLERAQNGTTAAIHLAAAVIYHYHYHGPIVEATMIQAIRWWKRRESAYQTQSGSAEMGTLVVYKGLDDDVKRIVEHFRKYPL